MKKSSLFLSIIMLMIIQPSLVAQRDDMYIDASDGDLSVIINGDTLADGTQAHEYVLTSTDMVYIMTSTINAKGDLSIMGEVDEDTGRPPAIQPGVQDDGNVLGKLFNLSGDMSSAYFADLYLLAASTNGTANGGGVAIEVQGEEIDLEVYDCVFDGWQTFAIAYNGDWPNMWIHDNIFRNMVHPNQHYIGEVVRNTWPNEAYTDTLSMVGNIMLGINGYAACPVAKNYMNYFEFDDNMVLYTFKNPLHIFNTTHGTVNDNMFYGTYAGGVDQAENPWWDNLWFPDTSYGVVALQPLSPANAYALDPDGDTLTEAGLAAIEAQRDIEVSGNIVYWPTALVDHVDAYNDTATNWVYTADWMSERTAAMFADDAAYPHLTAEDNMFYEPNAELDAEMAELNDGILNGTSGSDVGLLDWFLEVRNGTAGNNVWGFGYTVVDVGNEDWVPTWPLPEMEALEGALGVVNSETDPMPERFTLEQNFPNPFNPTTEITFTLNQESDITLTIFNMLGQEVKELTSGFKPVGKYTVQWNGKDNLGRSVSTGVYLYSLNNGTQVLTKKMVLMK